MPNDKRYVMHVTRLSIEGIAAGVGWTFTSLTDCDCPCDCPRTATLVYNVKLSTAPFVAESFPIALLSRSCNYESKSMLTYVSSYYSDMRACLIWLSETCNLTNSMWTIKVTLGNSKCKTVDFLVILKFSVKYYSNRLVTQLPDVTFMVFENFLQVFHKQIRQPLSCNIGHICYGFYSLIHNWQLMGVAQSM